eukprot:9446656-Heterocapsa_arctica.AAC.1
MPTMMRSRGFGNDIRASTYQYHPDYLLYHSSMEQHPPVTLFSVILNTIPPHLQEGWKIIKRGF